MYVHRAGCSWVFSPTVGSPVFWSRQKEEAACCKACKRQKKKKREGAHTCANVSVTEANQQTADASDGRS